VAALRELWEETGVTADLTDFIAKTEDWVTYDLPPELLGKVWGGKYRGQRQKWFLYRFTGADDQINIATAHPEFARWQWMQANAMLAAIVPFKRDVYAQVIDAFRSHLA
jgi:putative (di)nucleoside polyphosphate hydrolase